MSFVIDVLSLSDVAVFVVGGFIVESDASVGGMNSSYT